MGKVLSHKPLVHCCDRHWLERVQVLPLGRVASHKPLKQLPDAQSADLEQALPAYLGP